LNPKVLAETFETEGRTKRRRKTINLLTKREVLDGTGRFFMVASFQVKQKSIIIKNMERVKKKARPMRPGFPVQGSGGGITPRPPPPPPWGSRSPP
jgi:hypothetical protein